MNAELLLREFNHLSDAPDAVARLRRFVIDLAVRGKLLDQDPGDEPAALLVQRIEALSGVRKLRTAHRALAIDEVSSLEVPFAIPPTWTWTRLGRISNYLQRGKSPSYSTSGGSPVVSQKCVRWEGLDLSVARAITRESLERYGSERFLRDGDLLWNSTGTGTIGRVARVTEPPDRLVCDSHVTLVRCPDVIPEYVRIWLRSDHVYGRIEDGASGSTNQVELTLQMALSQIVPLPPLAEQERIVAKVDELMALCDRLETAQEEAEWWRNRLSAASLKRLVTPADTEEEAVQKDIQFFFSHSSRMVTNSKHVADMRQAILGLAVQGRLTRQFETDTHAQELLREASSVSVDSRGKSTPAIDGLPSFEEALPSTWSWCTVGQIASKVTDGEHLTPRRSTSGYWLLSARNVTDRGIDLSNVDYVDQDEFRRIRKRCDPNIGDVLVSCSGSVGRVALVDRDDAYVMVRSAAMIRPFTQSLTPYLVLALKSPVLQAQISARSKTTAQANLFLGAIKSLHLPLPPLQEQDRIVDKVNELMEVCDALERSLGAARFGRARALEAVLHQVLEDTDSPLPEFLDVSG